MVSVCPNCGTEISNAVDAVMHYTNTGAAMGVPCDHIQQRNRERAERAAVLAETWAA